MSCGQLGTIHLLSCLPDGIKLDIAVGWGNFKFGFLKKNKNKGGLKKERKCFSQKRPFLFFTYNQIWYQWTSWGPFALEFFLILTFDFLVHQVGSVLLTVLQIVLQKVYEWVSNFKEYTQDYSSLEDLQRLKTKERVL